LGGSKGERKLEAETRVKPKFVIDKMYYKGREYLNWQRDGRRSGNVKEGKGEVSSLAK